LLFYDFPDKSTISTFLYFFDFNQKEKNLVEKIKTALNCQTIDSKPSKKLID